VKIGTGFVGTEKPTLLLATAPMPADGSPAGSAEGFDGAPARGNPTSPGTQVAPRGRLAHAAMPLPDHQSGPADAKHLQGRYQTEGGYLVG